MTWWIAYNPLFPNHFARVLALGEWDARRRAQRQTGLWFPKARPL